MSAKTLRNTVGVVGICGIDVIAQYPADKIKAGSSVSLPGPLKFAPGGMALNCASALKNLGVSAKLFARVPVKGDMSDILYPMIRRGLGVDVLSEAVEIEHDTLSCISIIQHDEEEGRHIRQRSFLAHASSHAFISPDEFIARDRAMKKCSFIHFAGVGRSKDPKEELLLHHGVVQIMRQLQGHGVRFSCDFVPQRDILADAEWNSRISAALTLMDYILPSDFEATLLAGDMGKNLKDSKSIKKKVEIAAENIQNKFRNSRVIVKSGNNGCYMAESHGVDGGWVDAQPDVDVIDPTGAGDVWCAGFLFAERDYSIRKACCVANVVAAQSLKSWGGSCIDLDPVAIMQAAKHRTDWSH